jgi:hypothetical protein
VSQSLNRTLAPLPGKEEDEALTQMPVTSDRFWVTGNGLVLFLSRVPLLWGTATTEIGANTGIF